MIFWLRNKSSEEIKQGIIDSLKNIQFNVIVANNLKTIDDIVLKINNVRKCVDALMIRLTRDEFGL